MSFEPLKTVKKMKCRFLSFVSVALLAGLVCFTSCKKEEQVVATFTASMEDCGDVRNAKTVLSGTALQWVEGDEIKIHSGTSAVFTATPLDPATTATFATTDGNFADAGSYVAYYPADNNLNQSTVRLPATQESEDGSLIGFPMHAYANGSKNLQFRNLCGVLKVNLQKTGVTVTSIRLTMGSPINGDYTVNDMLSNQATLSSTPISGTGSNTTTLVCNQDITMAHDFYIYLPAGTYSGLTLEITASDGFVCTKGPATGSVVIERSKYSTLTLGGNDLVFVSPYPEGVLPGVFTVVNENNVTCTVHFSKGNLQYKASTTTWRFADHQYDFVGDDTYGNVYENGVKSDNTRIGENRYTGWIDLFGWGTGNNPTASSRFDDYSHFVDWGVNTITGGGAANTWRTLSVVEWDYIFVNRPNASSKRGLATVDEVHGLVLLPDNWTMPNGITSLNTTLSDWTDNEYDVSQWAQMEASGAVFLPASGQGSGQIGEVGPYWSYISAEGNDHPQDYEYTDNDGIGLRFATFNIGLVATGYIGWPSLRLSVRLVRNEN